jgi:hypothetical protein
MINISVAGVASRRIISPIFTSTIVQFSNITLTCESLNPEKMVTFLIIGKISSIENARFCIPSPS